jgi:hypothetical protein
MSFNYSAIKSALREAGYAVSKAEGMLAHDFEQLVTYSRLVFGLHPSQVLYGMAYPSLLPKNFPGHPDAEKDADDVKDQQPVAQQPRSNEQTEKAESVEPTTSEVANPAQSPETQEPANHVDEAVPTTTADESNSAPISTAAAQSE